MPDPSLAVVEKPPPIFGPGNQPICNPFSRSAFRSMLRPQNRPRLLGSPFDPEKASTNGTQLPWESPLAKRRRVSSESEEDEATVAGPSNALRYPAPPVDDIFSPSRNARTEQPRVKYVFRGRRLD